MKTRFDKIFRAFMIMCWLAGVIAVVGGFYVFQKMEHDAELYGAIHEIAVPEPTPGSVAEHELYCPRPVKVVDSFMHEARKGDTLASLARKYHIRLRDLARDNGISLEELGAKKHKLQIGDPVLIKRRVYLPEEGLASFYGEGDGFAGEPRSDGKTYHPAQWLVAHKFYPDGIGARITTAAGRSVIVPVRDKGPYHGCDRIVDLSPAVRDALGIPAKQGLAWVRVEPVFDAPAIASTEE